MAMFFTGLALFFGAHGALLWPGVRARSPELPRKGVVTLAAFAGLALVVFGWGPAGAMGVAWTPPLWTRHVTLALMLPALILLIAAYAPAGRIKKLAKHPMLASIKVWAFAHLVANGEWRSIALFGAFLAYAVIARIALKRRGDMGAAGATPGLAGDAIAVIGGAAAYGAIAYYLHPILFGVAVVG